jgi:hypothetical protein
VNSALACLVAWSRPRSDELARKTTALQWPAERHRAADGEVAWPLSSPAYPSDLGHHLILGSLAFERTFHDSSDIWDHCRL